MSTISEPTRRIVAQSNSGCKVAHYFFERSSLKWLLRLRSMLVLVGVGSSYSQLYLYT